MLRSAAKSLAKVVLLVGIVGGATAGLWVYERRQSTAWQIQQLEKQRQKLDGKLHDLTVKVNKSGYAVRARKRYLASRG